MVLPTDAFLHEGSGGVDDKDDHCSEVAAELEDDEHPSTEGLAGYETSGPLLNLGYKGAWQDARSLDARRNAMNYGLICYCILTWRKTHLIQAEDRHDWVQLLSCSIL